MVPMVLKKSVLPWLKAMAKIWKLESDYLSFLAERLPLRLTK